MIDNLKRCIALLPVLFAGAATAEAASPVGTWIDHTGRGAVEITQCGNAMCGKVVWVKSAADKEGCNIQVIGNVKPVGAKWDGGWIYDPEKGEKYDVELTPVGDNKLKVLGYLGMKMFGETMMWTRAPANLDRCDRPARSAAVVAPGRVSDVPPRAAPAAPAPARVAEVTPQPAPAAEPEAAPAPAPTEEAGQQAEAAPEPVPAPKKTGKAKTCSFNVPELGKVSMPCNTMKKIAEWLQ